MASGFHKYYDELNKKVEEELISQEAQQKELHDKIETHEKKIKTIAPLIERRNQFKLTILEKLPDLRGKIIIFRFLSKFKTERKVYKENKFLSRKFLAEKLKRKFLNNLKKATLLEKTDEFEEKIKQKSEIQLRNLQEGLQKQKEELLQLIYKAEEKLKHENRKKVQTKLQLDQIVLRGISALNLKALALSQNSLNGKDNF
jgi:chromosome segregation ATPase